MIGRALLLTLIALPAAVAAQQPREARPDWRLQVSAVISGTSYESEPAGYKLYSGVALEAAVVRGLGQRASVELSVRTESREVEGPVAGQVEPLGSVEMLPVTLTGRWHPLGPGSSVQPFVGVGVNLTTTWEKSGAIDSTDLPPRLSPAVQMGVDIPVADRLDLTVGARWHRLTVDIEHLVPVHPRVKIDPIALGVGVGVAL